MAQLTAVHEAQLAEMRAAVEDEKQRARDETTLQLQGQHDAALVAEKASTSDKLYALEVNVGALEAVLSHDTRYKQVSHATHQLAAAVYTAKATPTPATVRPPTQERAHARRPPPPPPLPTPFLITRQHKPRGRGSHPAPYIPPPASPQLATLPKLASKIGDELLVEALAPLGDKGAPEKYAKAPTLLQLAKRFQTVAAAGRVAALVPEAAPGLWGYALATITSAMTLHAAENGQTDASLTFAAAEAALDRGDLRSAVSAVRHLEGPPKHAASGWLQAAEDRLYLDQLLTVATAASTVSTAALAPF